MQCGLGDDLLAPVAGLAGGWGVAKAARIACCPGGTEPIVWTGRGLLWTAPAYGGGWRGKKPAPILRTDRGKLGSKHHVLTDAQGTPLAAILTGANRHDAMYAVAALGGCGAAGTAAASAGASLRGSGLCLPGGIGKPCGGEASRRPWPGAGRLMVAAWGCTSEWWSGLNTAGLCDGCQRCTGGQWSGRWGGWLHQFRRLRVRYERRADIHEAFLAFGVFPHLFQEPTILRWRKPRSIFVNSMSDLFHDRVGDDFIRQVFAVMEQADWHRYQALTKRPERVVALNDALPWPHQVWLGVSVENAAYTRRIDLLRQTDAAVKFRSLEPLLGPLPNLNLDGIDWVIVGGESGSGARPMQANWARDLRDQCLAAGVPFPFQAVGRRFQKAPGPPAGRTGMERCFRHCLGVSSQPAAIFEQP